MCYCKSRGSQGWIKYVNLYGLFLIVLAPWTSNDVIAMHNPQARLLQLHLPHHYLERTYDPVCKRVSDMRGVSASIVAELLVALPSSCVQVSGSQSVGSRTFCRSCPPMLNVLKHIKTFFQDTNKEKKSM